MPKNSLFKMNSRENGYRKQEKLFKMLFVAMCLALGVLYYQTFFTPAPPAAKRTADCNTAGPALCALSPGQGKTVDNLVPALCCQNRK